jgi:magnesium-transporting ATPase (P-type)
VPASAACPACGIYYFKSEQASPAPDLTEADDESCISEHDGFVAELFKPLENMDAMTFYGRCIALLFLAIWSWFLFGYDYRYGEINMSFMHDILLPIHEAGHVLFRPFGEFMMILGGSLFQLMLPLGIGIAFIVKNRDNFGAAIGLWWASVSLVDLSPYIYDALHPQLTLIGGKTGYIC